jgi:hypothetical protein
MATPAAPLPPSRPDALLHLAQARQNYELYQQLKQAGQHLDWAVTLLVYTALHLAEAYLAETASSAFDLPKGHEVIGPVTTSASPSQPLRRSSNTKLSRSAELWQNCEDSVSTWHREGQPSQTERRACIRGLAE